MFKIATKLIKQAQSSNLVKNIQEVGHALSMNAPNLGKLPTSTNALKAFNFGGKEFKFQDDLGSRLQRADAAMRNSLGRGLNITSGFRTAEEQQRLVNKIGGGKAIPGVVAPAGGSMHQYGAAVDIGNWQEAQPFLEQAGLINKLPKDPVHYTVNNGMSESAAIQKFRRY